MKTKESYKEPLKVGMTNRILYGMIYVEKIPLKLLADKLDVSTQDLINWCFEGELPDKKIREELAEYFDLPEQILFWEAKH